MYKHWGRKILTIRAKHAYARYHGVVDFHPLCSMALKQQSKLQQYFQSFRNSNDSAVVQIDKAGAAADADNNREGLKRSAEDEW